MATEAVDTRWPVEIRLKAGRKTLEVAFDDGERAQLPAELLRALTPSAERKGHAPSDEKIVGGKRNVSILGVEPVGSYAVRLRFDDMHQTGLYTFAFLSDLARRRDALFAAYEKGLAAAGLDRDRPGTAPWPGGSGLR